MKQGNVIESLWTCEFCNKTLKNQKAFDEHVNKCIEIDIETLKEIGKYDGDLRFFQLYRKVGFFFYPVIVGRYIVKKADVHIHHIEKRKETILNKIFDDVQKETEDILKKCKSITSADTYLIYPKKEHVISLSNTMLSKLTDLKKYARHFDNNMIEILNHSSDIIENIKKVIEEYNENFIQSRKKKYDFLFKKSPFPLDDDQKKAIITDDLHNLVVAGAGSGKTEVLTTRIAYLIKRKPDTIKSDRILALAFQKNAKNEIIERLKERYGVNVKVKTFHSLGYEILKKVDKGRSPEMMFNGDNEEKEYSDYIKSIFDDEMAKPHFQKEVIDFMINYGDSEKVKTQQDFKSMEDFYKLMRSLSYRTLNGIRVKSEAERDIFNFFFTHYLNGKKILFSYESKAYWMKYRDERGEERIPSLDFFFPDFNIYLEHWALDKHGRVPEWFQISTDQYKHRMEMKKKKFSEQDKYSLVESSSAEYYSNKNFNTLLEERLIAVLKKKNPGKNFTFTAMPYEDIVRLVWEECKAAVNLLPKNISNFIKIAKVYNIMPAKVSKRLNEGNWSKRQLAFGKMALYLYEMYQAELKRMNRIDFQDMINVAIDKLAANKNLFRNAFDHILIDEYQDISRQRLFLIKTLMDKNDDCRLFCVGDDWQSIMGFSGSNLEYFVNFHEHFEKPARTDLRINYRSIKSIVDTGATIIKQNKDSQLKKETIAHDKREHKIRVYASSHKKGFENSYYRQIAEHCINNIYNAISTKGIKKNDIMILSRILKNTRMMNHLEEAAKDKGIPIKINSRSPNCIPILSVHGSKGLQAKFVIIINMDDGLYGFPCQLENPDIFEPVIEGRKQEKFEEERRLFYVAVTRAKEDVFIYCQKCNESQFLKDIENHTEYEILPLEYPQH